jgi:hypothetical protein
MGNGDLGMMRGREERTTPDLPGLIRCPKTLQVRREDVKPWQESVSDV